MSAPVVQKVVLGAVIVRDGRALILKRSMDEDILPGLWELPSGKKEPLEEPVAALRREVEEETGLAAEPVRPVNVFGYVTEKNGERRDSTQVDFLMTVTDGTEPRLSEAHDEFAWVGADELDRYEVSDGTRESLLAGLAAA